MIGSRLSARITGYPCWTCSSHVVRVLDSHASSLQAAAVPSSIDSRAGGAEAGSAGISNLRRRSRLSISIRITALENKAMTSITRLLRAGATQATRNGL